MSEEKVNEVPKPAETAPVPDATETNVMNKDELIAAIHGALQGRVTKKDIVEIYDATVASVRQGLVDGKLVRIAGLGTFQTKKIGERAGRNPRSQEAVTIPAHREIRFRPADDLKRKVFPVA
jgi:DNA-binding protein HU-beta